MKNRPNSAYNQSGVLPFRRTQDDLEVLLVRSRKGKHWVIPKGCIGPGLSARDSAAKEAFEEAGIRGHVYSHSIGTYTYRKWGGTCTVQVFLFKADQVLAVRPEAGLRRRQWMSVYEAEACVEEWQLKQMLVDLQTHTGGLYEQDCQKTRSYKTN